MQRREEKPSVVRFPARGTALLLALLSLQAAVATAAVVKDVTIPDTVEVGGRVLRLNGTGIRSKFFVDVYAAALHVTTPSPQAATLIAADEPKRMVMHFLHSKVESGKINDAWREGFQANAAPSLPALQERLDRFTGFFTQDLLRGDTVVFTYLPGEGTLVEVKGTLRGTIQGEDFMRALFSVWLGESPVDKGLKKGLLANP
jgi:hypothetical protein